MVTSTTVANLRWALFGNDDDGIYGPDWFNKGRETSWVAIKWWLRNPCHNLTFYVPPFGYALWTRVPGAVRVTATWYGKKTERKFCKVWNIKWLAFREFKTSWIEGYFGHRERGNFGVALRRPH